MPANDVCFLDFVPSVETKPIHPLSVAQVIDSSTIIEALGRAYWASVRRAECSEILREAAGVVIDYEDWLGQGSPASGEGDGLGNY